MEEITTEVITTEEITTEVITTERVFGKAITTGSRSQRAAAAVNGRNVGEKRDKAVSYVKRNVSDVTENRRLGTTLCIFYNATGLPLTNPNSHDYQGTVRPPNPPTVQPNPPTVQAYPPTVENGQWGAFLHQEAENSATGSKAYVRYCVGVGDTNECIGLMGWKTPHNEPNDIHALCDVYEREYDFNNEQISTAIDQGSKKTKSTNSSNFVKFISMTASIRPIGTSTGTGTAPLFEAIFENA